MSNKLFSIIVPVYNVENYLVQCVESLLDQSYKNYEILLVDDGSTDKSGVLCDKYAEQSERIKVLHKSNGGLSDARNYGVVHSSGEYIVFVDSDDYVTKDMLTNMNEVIAQNPEVDLVTSREKFLLYKDTVINGGYVRAEKDLNDLTGIEALIKILKSHKDDWNAPGKCFSRELWDKNYFAFKKGRLSEDVELIYKVYIKAGKVAVIDPFYYYRQAREGSIISTPSEKLVKDTILNLKEWDQYLMRTELPEELKQLLYERFSMQYCTTVLGMISAFDENVKNQLIVMAKEIENYLLHSNQSLVRVIRFINQLLGMNFTSRILYLLRISRKITTRLKWEWIVLKSERGKA